MTRTHNMAIKPATPPEPTPSTLPDGWQRRLLATRPAFLSITMIGVVLGITTAWYAGVNLNAANAGLTLLFALAAHAGANVINDFHDQAGDAQNLERVFPFTGGSRFIQNGLLSPAETMRLGYGLLAAVIPAGLWLTAQAGAGLIVIGLAGLIVGWAYSAPPLRLASRGLGEFAIVAGWLLVVAGSDYVQRGAFALLPLAAGSGFAMLVAAVLYINQFPDFAADGSCGKRTVVVRLGRSTARWGYPLLILLAYTTIPVAVVSGVFPLPTLAALAALPFSCAAAAGLWRFALEPQRLVPAIKLTILAAHLFGALLFISLIFTRIFQ